MGSTRTDKINLDVIINGDRAGKTLDELTKAQKELNSELKKVAIGSAEYNKLRGDLQNVNAKLSETRNEIKGVSSQMSHGKQMAMELAGGLGIAFGIEKVIEFGKASFEAFMEAEESAHKLEFALKNITNEGGSFDRLNNLAGTLQEKGIFDDESIRNTETALIQFGLTADQVEVLTPKILDLAAATGKTLPEATQLVIKGIEGHGKKLADLGIFIDDTGTKMGNLDQIYEQSTKFQGANAAALETTGGKMAKVKNEINDAMEKVGKMLVDIYNMALKPWVDALSSIFTVIGNIANRLGLTNDKLSGFDVVIKYITKALELATIPLRVFAKGVVAIGDAIDYLYPAIKKGTVAFEDFMYKVSKALEAGPKKQVDLTKLTLAQLKELHTAAADDEIKRREKAMEAFKKDNEKIKKETEKLLATIDKMEEEAYLKSLKDDQREVEAVRLKYRKLYEEAGKNKAAILRLEKLEKDEINDVREKQKKEKEKQNQEDWEAAIKEAERQIKILTDIEIKDQKDRIDEYKKNAEAKKQVAQALSDSLNAIASIAAEQGTQSAEFMKALALFQIGIDTAKAISSGIAGATTSATATGPGAFVATPVFIATTIATVLGAMAQASKVLSSTGSAPKFAQGGPTFAKGGRVKKPFLAMAGEEGEEWISPNWMVTDPKLAPIFDILENIRTSKTYAAGGPTTSTQTPAPAFTPSTNTGGSVNGELLVAVRQLTAVLQGGIAAVFDYDYFNKSKARAEAAKSSAQIGKS